MNEIRWILLTSSKTICCKLSFYFSQLVYRFLQCVKIWFSLLFHVFPLEKNTAWARHRQAWPKALSLSRWVDCGGSSPGESERVWEACGVLKWMNFRSLVPGPIRKFKYHKQCNTNELIISPNVVLLWITHEMVISITFLLS